MEGGRNEYVGCNLFGENESGCLYKRVYRRMKSVSTPRDNPLTVTSTASDAHPRVPT